MLEPLEEGGAEGNLPDIEAQIEEYYQTRGWNTNAVPISKKNRRIGFRCIYECNIEGKRLLFKFFTETIYKKYRSASSQPQGNILNE